MMKAILLVLIAFGSSSALAQHNVPGGGPVGSPGNPGTYHPGGYNPGPGGGGNPGGGYPGNGGVVHVPGGGPVGSPGNPGTYHPPYGNGNNGGYNPYPGNNYPNGGYNPYPGNNYPTNYPLGPCSVNSEYSGGAQYYTIFDGRGNYIIAVYDYNQAIQTAEEYERMGYCHGIKINVQNPGPNPYPNPNPYPQTYCTVMPGQDAYGNQFYRVLDRAGRIIYTSAIYSQALQVSQSDARCFQYNEE